MASTHMMFVVLLAAFGFALGSVGHVSTSTSTTRPQSWYSAWGYPGALGPYNGGWGYYGGLGAYNGGWGYPGALNPYNGGWGYYGGLGAYNGGWGSPWGTGYGYGYLPYSKRTVTTQRRQYPNYYGLSQVSTSHTTNHGPVYPTGVSTSTFTNRAPYGFPTGYYGGL